MVVLAGWLIVQMTYWFPNWLVVLVLVQLCAGWKMLEEIGILEMIESYIQTAEQSLSKLMGMIPRYKGASQ